MLRPNLTLDVNIFSQFSSRVFFVFFSHKVTKKLIRCYIWVGSNPTNLPYGPYQLKLWHPTVEIRFNPNVTLASFNSLILHQQSRNWHQLLHDPSTLIGPSTNTIWSTMTHSLMSAFHSSSPCSQPQIPLVGINPFWYHLLVTEVQLETFGKLHIQRNRKNTNQF